MPKSDFGQSGAHEYQFLSYKSDNGESSLDYPLTVSLYSPQRGMTFSVIKNSSCHERTKGIN